MADHAPSLFVSTLRRIIADVHGVPDFLDQPEILQVMQDPDPARASPLAHRLYNEVMGYFPHPQPFMEYI